MSVLRRENGINSLSAEENRLAKIYITSFFLIFIGLVQLYGFRVGIFHVGGCVPVTSFMWLVVVLLCFVLMVFMEMLNKFPVNWVLGLVAVESMTLCAVFYYWQNLSTLNAALIVISDIVITFALYLMGAFMPLAILPGFNAMMVITIAFIIGYILLTIFLHALKQTKIVLLVLDIWSLCYDIPLILYANSLIHHRHLTHLVSQEYMLSATLISTFFFFMIHMFTSTVTHCIMVHNEYFK